MLFNDVKYAMRMMRRTPLFTAAVVLTVAMAIGANTTIFSVVNAVMLKPLPFNEPNRIFQVFEKNDKLNIANNGASALNFLDWREQAHSFAAIAGVSFSNYTLTGSGEPEQLSGNLISSALTRVLGISPRAGRAFTDDEEKLGAAPVAMLGEGLWKRRFGADRSLVGRSILLNGVPTTVVGIAPASMNLLSGGDVYTPLIIDPSKEFRVSHALIVFGRLKNGVSMQQAQSEMDAVSAHVDQQYPEMHNWKIGLLSMFDTFVSTDLKTGLLVLLWAVGFVLLIACANIANLLLARAAARQGEMAVRAAMGASRGRLLRQLLIESVLLSMVGGVAGVMLAGWAIRGVNLALPPNTLPVPTIQMDATVLWFGLGLTVATGLFFGIAPAWRTAKVDLSTTLKQGGRGSGRMSARLRNVLAAAELALATILLIGAGLFIRTLTNLGHVQLGFEPQGLITFQLAPPVEKYPGNGKAQQFYRALLDSLQSLPGVRGAAVSSGIPFGAGNYTSHPMFTTGPSAMAPETRVPVDWRNVSPGYFKTMGIPLMRGRDFTDADNSTVTPVIIVSAATAKKFWGDADPLGRVLHPNAKPSFTFTVVGVVGDVRSTVLAKESPAFYYPVGQRVAPLMDVVVRTAHSPETLLPAIRERVHGLDSQLALANVRTMEQWLSNSSAQPRLNTVLLSTFAFVALLIASIGIYGVLAYSVSQRTKELGVRMALGATSRGVLLLVIREGAKVALIGIGAGVLGGLALAQAVSSLVFGVSVRDPAIFGGVATALAAVALAACYLPARRASRVDPMVALRYE
ncbi:MAG: ABC transporter permease [Candidatus Acidiferrales bacterium]